MSSISAPLSQAIQRRIDALQTDGQPAWVRRVCKERLNALPLQANEVFQWALRPDGEILCLDFEALSLPYGEEQNPVIRYAVLFEAAHRYPELRELEPPRPEGVQRCESCGGRGWIETAGSSCSRCHGVGWHVQPRPVAEWMERIDRGDQLRLQVHGAPERLVAAKIAGRYVARGDGVEPWSHPADAQGRLLLAGHLMRFGVAYVYSVGYQKHVIATWTSTPEFSIGGADHALHFSETGRSPGLEPAPRPRSRDPGAYIGHVAGEPATANAAWRELKVPTDWERLIGFSVPQDGTVLAVSNEGMHLLHLGPPVTVESDHDHADWDLWAGEGATFHYQGRAWEVLGLAEGRPLLTGRDGERLVVDVLSIDRGMISVVQHGNVVWSAPFKNFSGDWVSATFSLDGRFIVLGCPYDFDFHVWMRADDEARPDTTEPEPGAD
jgi:hypothetical protein